MVCLEPGKLAYECHHVLRHNTRLRALRACLIAKFAKPGVVPEHVGAVMSHVSWLETNHARALLEHCLDCSLPATAISFLSAMVDAKTSRICTCQLHATANLGRS
jgi:hypothetical protein